MSSLTTMTEQPRSGVRTRLAAGALCWRYGPAGLEVLLVHRPKYNDWSWPKGKLEPGELLPVCAVREVAEETGVQIRLGRPLPDVTYNDGDGRPKRVSYWAASVVRIGRRTASPREIDRTAWMPLDKARRKLTSPSDQGPLDALISYAQSGTLDTAPVLVVRHATARPRDSWTRADAERPLVESGRRQATVLMPLIDCWRPESVVSSPWRRCLQTVAPYVDTTGVRISTKGGLSERGFRRDPDKAAKHIQKLIDKARPAALCTHRPVLAGVMPALATRTQAPAIGAIPSEDPYLPPGGILVAQVLRQATARRVISVETYSAT